jgi:hypothetical protein
MVRFLLRLAHVLVLTAFVGQTTGFIPLIESRECEADCPGEGESDDEHSDEESPTSCHLCPCCPSLRLTSSELAVHVLPQSVLGLVGWDVRARPSSPEPREILHVPKRSA